MPSCFCSFNPPSTSISKFISHQPLLSILETNCHTIEDLRKFHAHLIKTGLARDTIAANQVLVFCATLLAPDLDFALAAFSRIEKPNVFTFRRFCQNSDPHVGVSIFVEMLAGSTIKPEKLTYPSVIKAYFQPALAKDVAQIHGRIIKLGLDFVPFLRNLIIIYANCVLLGNARKLFDENHDLGVVAWNSMIMGFAKCGNVEESCKIPSKNETSWITMISGFVRNGRWIEALDLFHEMQEKGIRPNEFILISALNACAKLGALKQGKWIHDYINRNDIELNVICITAIIDMYSKCKEIEKAHGVFMTAQSKGLSCWNSLMLGLATNGFEEQVLEFFTNLRPDSITFIGILTACSHSIQADKARMYVKLMRETHGIEPRIEHCGCMVDVLGRAGLTEEAAELVRSTPIRHDAVSLE